MVELERVSYRAGDALILHDVSVRFRPHRFNVILGPNGAGKSTMLRIATGLLRPSTGAVHYGDRAVTSFDAGALARTRAVLSQHVELAFPLPVQDVVMMGRYPHYGRAPSKQDREIVERALELVEMTHKRQQPYPTLSGGERQKVQLARVLAQIWNHDEPGEHKYLFLDEPTTSLDIHYQLHLLDVARALLERNCTVIAVLHDLNVAFQYGNTFFLVHGGLLVHETDCAEGISAELIEQVFRVRAVEEGGMWRFGSRAAGSPLSRG